MNTMQLAWNNAKWAHKWHGKGNKQEYLAGSLKLAHKGVSIKHRILMLCFLGCQLAFWVGFTLGAILVN